jgi:hypothetical protein
MSVHHTKRVVTVLVVVTGIVPAAALAATPQSQTRHLQEYRQTIEALYGAHAVQRGPAPAHCHGARSVR